MHYQNQQHLYEVLLPFSPNHQHQYYQTARMLDYSNYYSVVYFYTNTYYSGYDLAKTYITDAFDYNRTDTDICYTDRLSVHVESSSAYEYSYLRDQNYSSGKGYVDPESEQNHSVVIFNSNSPTSSNYWHNASNDWNQTMPLRDFVYAIAELPGDLEDEIVTMKQVFSTLRQYNFFAVITSINVRYHTQ